MVDNVILRQNAREQLGGNIFHSKWLTMLLVCGLSPLAVTLSGSFPIILFVIMGGILYGTARVTVKTVRGESWRFEEVFCGFSTCFVKTILLYLLQAVLIFLWTLLFVIPGLVKSYSYALAYYLQQEPGGAEAEPSELLAESSRLMNGYKWQLFCLDFSFIGWYILGALCFGIGTFFVVPYHQQARANFYLARVAEGV